MRTLITLLLLTSAASAQISFEYVGYVWCDTLEYKPRDEDSWGVLLDKEVEKMEKMGMGNIQFKKGSAKSDIVWIPEKLVFPAGWYYMAIVDGYPSLFDDKGKFVEPEMLCVKYHAKNKTKEKLKELNRYNHFRPNDDVIKDAEKIMKDRIKEKPK
jgi:hypothetical protein